MYRLTTTADLRQRSHINRFDPRFWTVNFPRPMMAAVTTTGPDALAVKLVFHKEDDLAGLVWASEDTLDHPLLAYATDRDYRAVRLSFRWQSSNVKPLDQVHGPTLTIEGRDSGGAPRTWFVRIWNYATGTPEDAVIDLDFSALDGGFLLPQEADPVWAGDIDRMFLSMIPDAFDGVLSGPLPGGEVVADVTLRQITVSGGGKALAIGDTYVKPHALRLATAYDDQFNVTPERLIGGALRLGYRGPVDHYVGMSHYYGVSWDAGEARFILDPAKPKLNAAASAWHSDYFARADAFGYAVVISLSYEILNDNAPSDWAQRTHDGSVALTGWSPPSTLIAPTNNAALTHLRDSYLALAGLMSGLTMSPTFQIGEPWWWYQLTGPNAPCFYDDATTALYPVETGESLPAKHLNIFETPTAAQQDYLDWLGDKLGGSTTWLKDELKAAHPGAPVTLLFFTPQVLRADAPMLEDVNFPTADWAHPAFDFLQVEDYDFVIAADWQSHAAALEQVETGLGYAPADIQYFAGFNLTPSTPQVWGNIDVAIADGFARGYQEVFVWAFPQVNRDGFTYFTLEEDVNGFHEVQFPTAISFRSSGGPEFSTSVIETASGFEKRNINWSAARARYDIGSGVKSEDDLAAVIDFFRARRGQAFGFRFKDWADYKSGAPSAAVSATDQAIGTGDGVATEFGLAKSYTSGAETYARRILKPVAGSVLVALDGTPQGAGWSVDAATGVITFTTPPGAGAAVTAGFEFDTPVRFAGDHLNVSLETFAAGAVPDIGLVEVRLADPLTP